MKKLLVTDGNAMLFRAYYATAYGKPMTTSQGIPTNAVFGFANMLQKAIDTVQPDAVLVAFDAGKHTFRHELYPEYKGGRKPAPDDLVPQFQMARDYLDAYGIRWVEMKDIEADDLIGSISLQSPEYDTYILSSDRDLLQLIDDTTRVLLMKKGITDMDVMTRDALKESLGIVPSQIIDLKGLMGDSSDNIPGVKGIGEKTALKLLAEYGTVENVLAHESELKGAVGKKIIEGHDSALMSKRLATIKRDVALDFTAEDCAFRPDYASLVTFLHSLDMRALAARYEDKAGAEVQTEAVQEESSYESVRVIPEELYQADAVALFVDETRGHFLDAGIYGLALCNKQKAYYIAWQDAVKDARMLAYLSDESNHLAGFDIKRNMHLFRNAGVPVHFADDAMILASLQDSTLTSPDKILQAFGLSTSLKYEDVYGKPNKPKMPMEEEVCTYACENARNIYTLYVQASAKTEELGMSSLYKDIEMPLTKILCDMEREGIRCQQSVLDGIAADTLAVMEAEQAAVYDLAGHEFNLNSPKQLSEVLYDELLLPGGKKRSTAADVLEKLAKYHPIIPHLLNYRKVAKLYSTYAEGLKKYIRPQDGRIHTIYNQCATQTGRLSSSEPNLQNISVRDEAGKQVRKAFPADEGCVLISSDYHQIELRMLAHMADEKGLIDAFNKETDVHTATAMSIFDVAEEDVTPLMRRQAKTVNFGIVYGISDFGLSEQLGVPVAEARDFIARYYDKYPRIRTYMQELVEFCEKNGYVKTLCGRRREIPEIRDKNRMVREFGKRAAMNAPVQGSAADLIKIAMIRIDEAMKQAGVKSRMILQVHDELIFEVPEDEIDTMKSIITDGMEHAMELKVPLSAECSIGRNWYEAK
ncbi:MAG: DNA polymerase I [Solobacterium sp.]|nr:DNA polymerase I [Solobacterium sp.]